MKNTKMRVISFIVALAMLVAVLPLTVIASELSSETDTSGDPVEAAAVIRDGETLTLTVPKKDDVTYTYVKFTPETGGRYILRSESDTDPCVELLSSELGYIARADDQNGSNFNLVYDYVAGNTYYFAICDYEGENVCKITLNSHNEHADVNGNGVCDYCFEFAGSTNYELTVGDELSVESFDDGVYVKFVAQKSGIHIFKSNCVNSPFDSYAVLYNSELTELVESEDISPDDLNFRLQYELEAGETYYIYVYQYYSDEETPITVTEACDVHTPATQNCLGYECSDCGAIYGEGNDIHSPSRIVNCRGTRCDRCRKYYGEPAYGHKDDNGDFWCDGCGSIFTELTVTVGENIASLIRGKYVYYKFIPTENGIYYFKSASRFNPVLWVYDENGDKIGENDDAYGSNFYLELELEAVKTYYLELYEFSEDNNCTVIINKLCDEHTPGERNCKGYECSACGAYYGEAYHENARWEFDTTTHNGYCEDCGQDVAIEEDHNFDADGKCVCGYFEHECVFDAYEYVPAYHWVVCSLCKCLHPVNEETPHEYNADGVCECGRKQLVGIYLGTALLLDGQYMDNDGNVSGTAPDGGYAHYNDGVLTLNNFKLVNYDENPVYGAVAIYSETDLEILLIGINHLETAGEDTIYVAGADLTVSGDGAVSIPSHELFESLDFSADGINVNAGNLTVNGATIYIYGSSSGIEVDGCVEINGGNLCIYSYRYGICAEKDITINGGIFELRAGLDGIFAGGAVTINGGIFDFNCQFSAIYSYVGIAFGDAMGDMNVVEDLNGFYWADSDDGIITNGQLAPKDEEKTMLKYTWVENALKTLVYNGEAQNPFGTVYNGDGIALIPGVDYTVEFSSEVKNAGVYSALVTGIGDYVGAYVILFSVHERYDLNTDSVLEFNAETTSSDVYTLVKFTAPTNAEYTFKINMGVGGFASVWDNNLNYVVDYPTVGGIIIFTLELEAGETVYFDVYTQESEPAPTTMSVEFVCDEHDMNDGIVTDEPTCTEGGEITYTCRNGCGHTYTEALGSIEHDFAEISRYYIECTLCGEGICDHMCHKGGIDALVWKIFEFIYDLFGLDSECDCGADH